MIKLKPQVLKEASINKCDAAFGQYMKYLEDRYIITRTIHDKILSLYNECTNAAFVEGKEAGIRYATSPGLRK